MTSFELVRNRIDRRMKDGYLTWDEVIQADFKAIAVAMAVYHLSKEKSPSRNGSNRRRD